MTRKEKKRKGKRREEKKTKLIDVFVLTSITRVCKKMLLPSELSPVPKHVLEMLMMTAIAPS